MKYESKPWDINSHLLEWTLSEREVTSVAYDVKKREAQRTAGRNVNWCSHYRK